MKKKYPVNTVLYTKDGRKVGNAIVIAHKKSIVAGVVGPDYYNVLKTDYGNICFLSDGEIPAFFHGETFTASEVDMKPHKHLVK